MVVGGKAIIEATERTLLLTIAHRVAMNWLRRHYHGSQLVLHEDVEQVASDKTLTIDDLIRYEDMDRLRHVIDQLPPELGVILHLRHYEGMKFEEIAQCLGMTLGTVTGRYYRAIKSIREQLGLPATAVSRGGTNG
jgi:RNA polymerase sigma-70 factor (ECF subfamily)